MAQERESLEQLREELESSKKKIGSMESRLNTQIQEVEALRKVTPPPMIFQTLTGVKCNPCVLCSWQLAVQKYEKGEHALQEAKSAEAEHEAQLTHIHRRKEQLWKREQHVLQACVMRREDQWLTWAEQ